MRGEVNDGRAAGIPGDQSPRPSSKGGRQVRTDIFLPAAGNRNGTSLNNAGSNGNYWSSSPNPNNSDNAYNLNFNSGNYDWNNNNLAMCRRTLSRAEWGDSGKAEFVDYLLETIVRVDPTDGCVMRGDAAEWGRLAPEKSLFHSPADCGLPIGNLSSQLFSNVYLNAFDQFCKRSLGVRHYGRYVDDAYFVSSDRESLKALRPEVRRFLREELGLEMSEYKLQIYDAYKGVPFLGAYLKPYRTYVSNGTLRRIRRKVLSLPADDTVRLRSSVNSFLGVFGHCDTFLQRRALFLHQSSLPAYGRFSADCLRFTLF